MKEMNMNIILQDFGTMLKLILSLKKEKKKIIGLLMQVIGIVKLN